VLTPRHLPPVYNFSDPQCDRRQWLIASAWAACVAQIRIFDLPAFAEDVNGSPPVSKSVAQPAAQADTPAAAAEVVLAERFVFLDEKQKPRDIIGKSMLEAVDGSFLVQGIDSQIWRVSADRLKQRTPGTKPFSPISKPDLGAQLVQEMGADFHTHLTKTYVICTNTSAAYAKWCGDLLERLATAFQVYWNHRDRGFKTVAPEFPLVALIFQQQTQYAEFATADVGPDVATAPGYYSGFTNRIVFYDLAFDKRRQPANSDIEIEQRLSAVISNVATMIHEATHQIAFNCGMHTRLAENPLWLTEGMATYFEMPDLKSKTGWKTVGLLNKARLKRFKDFLAQRRKVDSLTSLIRDEERFTSVETGEDAYAESWALTYYLIRKQPEAYVKYLTFLAAKKPLDYAQHDQRVAEFTEIFGELRAVDKDFIKYIKTLK
jgi:hypothetical protein